MLTYQPEKRVTVSEVLRDPWFMESLDEDNEDDENVAM
jgi:hypothetical protein